jgi:4-hydroxyphenylacetate 3-monooxygenase
VEGLLYGMEVAGEPRGKSGHWAPRRNMLYAAQVYTQALYAKFTNDIRELAGGGLIMLPSSGADFGNPELADIIERTQISSRDGETALDRVKFLNLAWDALGSEYAGRHAQYEAFYAGAQFVTCGHSMRTYPWEEVDGLVQSALDGFELNPGVTAQAAE